MEHPCENIFIPGNHDADIASSDTDGSAEPKIIAFADAHDVDAQHTEIVPTGRATGMGGKRGRPFTNPPDGYSADQWEALPAGKRQCIARKLKRKAAAEYRAAAERQEHRDLPVQKKDASGKRAIRL